MEIDWFASGGFENRKIAFELIYRADLVGVSMRNKNSCVLSHSCPTRGPHSLWAPPPSVAAAVRQLPSILSI